MGGSGVVDAYAINNTRYKVGDAVYVQIPQGKTNAQKFIIGRKMIDGDGTPFEYHEVLDDFIPFETLEGAFNEGHYRANNPEDGQDITLDPNYVLERQRLAEQQQAYADERDAKIAGVKQAVAMALAPYVDSEGQIIGSEGEDASKINIVINQHFADIINGAVSSTATVTLDQIYSEMFGWTEGSNAGLQTTNLQLADIAVTNAYSVSTLHWTYQDSMNAHAAIWDEYWNSLNGEEARLRLSDAKIYVENIRRIEREQIQAIINEYQPLIDHITNVLLPQLNAQYSAEDTANLLFSWDRPNKNNAMISTKIGLQAEWTTYLGQYLPISGEYGLRIQVTGVTKGSSGYASATQTKTKWFTSKDMYGNPYAYAQKYRHQIILDISEYQRVDSVYIYFFQDHNFRDNTDQMIPYMRIADDGVTSVLVNPNINCWTMKVMLGMTKDEFDGEQIFFWSYDDLMFGSTGITSEAADMDLQKTMQFMWLHQDGDELVLINNERLLAKYGASICWYHKTSDAHIVSANPLTTYGGLNFELIEDASTQQAVSLDEYMEQTPYDQQPSAIQAYGNYIKTYNAAIDAFYRNSKPYEQQVQDAAAYITAHQSELEAKYNAANEAYQAIGEQVTIYNKFKYTATLDPSKYQEAFRVAVAYDGTYIASDILVFTNRNGGLGADTSTEEVVFKVLRWKYQQNSGGAFTQEKIEVDENRQAFFVYDQRNNAIEDESNRNYAEVDFFLQIWVRNHATDEYMPLILDQTLSSLDDLQIDWVFPSVNSMIANWEEITEHEAQSMPLISEEVQTFSGRSYTGDELRALINNTSYAKKTTRKFHIQHHWDIRYTNNTITATVVKNGMTYKASITFQFGNNSTDGSPYVLVVNQISPSAQSLEQNKYFEFRAQVYDTSGNPIGVDNQGHLTNGGGIFQWRLLSPTLITDTNGGSVLDNKWYNSTYNILSNGGMDNTISGYILNDLPPIFEVSVRNIADYELTQLVSTMLTNDREGLIDEYHYSLPNRVEFKSNGESPIYIASDFMKWLENDKRERIQEYPEWYLKQKVRTDQNNFEDRSPPDYMELICTEHAEQELQTNANPTITVENSTTILNAIKKSYADAVAANSDEWGNSSWQWDAQNLTFGTTVGTINVSFKLITNLDKDNWNYNEEHSYYVYRDFLDQLLSNVIKGAYGVAAKAVQEQYGASETQLKEMSTALDKWNTAAIAGITIGKQTLNSLENVHKYRKAYYTYNLNNYCNEDDSEPWTWIEGMDENYYTYIGYNIVDENNQIRYVRQSICFDRNLYCSSVINAWDGALVIDKEKKMILTRMLAAGVKDEYNRFCGVMIGDWTDETDGSLDSEITHKAIGIYSFEAGEQIFAVKNDGTGFIGPAGHGRITFDGRQALISNYNRSCYINLDPNLIDLNGDFIEGHSDGYSQFFMYAKTPRVANTRCYQLSTLEERVGWASKYFNDLSNDYFIVDPNNGVLTTGGIIATYGKLGNWLIGEHGLYQYYSAKVSEDKFANHYMYLGYNSTGDGYLTGDRGALYIAEYDTDEWGTQNNLTNAKLQYHDENRIENEWSGELPSEPTIASIKAAMEERHNNNLHVIEESSFSREERADYLLKIITECHQWMPTTCFEYDPVHYMNIGWAAKWVYDYLMQCIKEGRFEQNSSGEDIAQWLKDNIAVVINEENFYLCDHYHYNADGSIKGTYRTGGRFTGWPLLGYSSSSYNPPQVQNASPSYFSTFYNEYPDSMWFETMYYALHSNNYVSYDMLWYYANKYILIYNFYFNAYYRQLVTIWEQALENRENKTEPYIPDEKWAELQKKYPKFFNPPTPSNAEDIQNRIAAENARYKSELDQLYIDDDEHKYAIFAGYDPDVDPIFSVNWRGYMTARAGKIGYTSPWWLTDYGLTQTNNFGTIFLGDETAPSNPNLWVDINQIDRKELILLPNEDKVYVGTDNSGQPIYKKLYLQDTFHPTITEWDTEVSAGTAAVLTLISYNDPEDYSEEPRQLQKYVVNKIPGTNEDALSTEVMEQINNGTALIGPPLFNTFGRFAMYAGHDNNIYFGVRTDGSVYMNRAELNNIRLHTTQAEDSEFYDIDIYNGKIGLPDGTTSWQMTSSRHGITEYTDENGNKIRTQAGKSEIIGIDGTHTVMDTTGTSYSYVNADGETVTLTQQYPTKDIGATQQGLNDAQLIALAGALVERDAVMVSGSLSGWTTTNDGSFVNMKYLQIKNTEGAFEYKIGEALCLDAQNSQLRACNGQIVVDGYHGVLFIGRPLVVDVDSETGAPQVQTWAQMFLGAIGMQATTKGATTYNATIQGGIDLSQELSQDISPIEGLTISEIGADDNPAEETSTAVGEPLILPNIDIPNYFQFMDKNGHTTNDPEITFPYDTLAIAESTASIADSVNIESWGGTSTDSYTEHGINTTFILGQLKDKINRDSYKKVGIIEKGIIYAPLTDGSALGDPGFLKPAGENMTAPVRRWTIYSHNIFLSKDSHAFVGEDDELAKLSYVNGHVKENWNNLIKLNNAVAEALNKANQAIAKARAALRKALNAIALANEALAQCVDTGSISAGASGVELTYQLDFVKRNGEHLTGFPTTIYACSVTHGHPITLNFTSAGVTGGTDNAVESGTLTETGFVTAVQAIADARFETGWASVTATASGSGTSGSGTFTVTVKSPGGTEKTFTFNISITTEWTHDGSVTGRGDSAGDGHYLGNGSTGYLNNGSKVSSWSVS